MTPPIDCCQKLINGTDLVNVRFTKQVAELKHTEQIGKVTALIGEVALSEWDRSEGMIRSLIGVQVLGVPAKDSKPEEAIVTLQCSVLLAFKVTDPECSPSQEDLDKFSISNARFNAWPYLREGILSSCSRLEIAPIVLPPIHSGRTAAAD